VNTSNVNAVLFVKDLRKVSTFYSKALGMKVTSSDEHHAVLSCGGFELVVHQIPKHIAATIVIRQPPERRVGGAIRLDYPVQDLEQSRRTARALGGGIDDQPPPWADSGANFLGHDPEGNQFGVRQCS
jgi:predicted enzyme related to lactoylglutathione lyase